MEYIRKSHIIQAVPYSKGMESGMKMMEKIQAESIGIKDIYLSWNSHKQPKTSSDAAGMIDNNRPVEIPFIITPRGMEFIASTDMIVTFEGHNFPMSIDQFNKEYEPKSQIFIPE